MKEIIINHNGTRMVKDGEDWLGLQTTNLTSLAKLFKPFNRDWAPLMNEFEKISFSFTQGKQNEDTFKLTWYLFSSARR